MQAVISSIISRAVAAGMPVGVHAADAAAADRHAEQGATIVTAAVDTTVLSDAVHQQLARVREAHAARPAGGLTGGQR